MVIVDILDPKATRHRKTVVKTARWLMRRFKKGDFLLEIALVPSRIMPKNVLAFPAKAKFPRPDLQKLPLGEIYLNPTLIVSQGWTITYMIIHGFLHLLGYDHMKKNDRMKMEQLEQKLLKKLLKTQSTE